MILDQCTCLASLITCAATTEGVLAGQPKVSTSWEQKLIKVSMGFSLESCFQMDAKDYEPTKIVWHFTTFEPLGYNQSKYTKWKIALRAFECNKNNQNLIRQSWDMTEQSQGVQVWSWLGVMPQCNDVNGDWAFLILVDDGSFARNNSKKYSKQRTML